jgi:hypothetical protein
MRACAQQVQRRYDVEQEAVSSSARNQAEALAIGLEIGATSVAEVVAWADSVITAEERPHWSVCELATMSKSYEPDVANALREVPGELDAIWVRKEVVRMLARGLAADRRRADQIASALYNLAMAENLPTAELRSVAWWAWDALSLADEGVIQETRDQIVNEMLDALQGAAERQPDDPTRDG